ncbi:long-chain fatty acid--CoA ligase [Egibacter rhizosphaerae]|uniref:Acyl-CoA synthetase n=1 Tax=Egibacter rhizosphaerae TaxID=1670831 RepID=A0A411YAE4_9ACTN|nr:long-chain fatty acid--CoA ligase [Egibacter rhizosphaerae]QBI18174.1 long-chain fatty acid--CoA ligase [Egibacter rhizosphaerae]
MVQRTANGPTPVEVPKERNLVSTLWERADAGDQRQILRFYEDGGWQGLTWPQLAERVEAIAAGLMAAGVEPGDRVALLSPTRVEWTIADLAILAAGGVTVPIYETSSVDQTAWILEDSGAKLAFASNADFAKVLDQARSQAPGLGEVFVFDDGGLDALAERAGDTERAGVRERAATRTGDDLFSLIYTSGTTGNPKGCMLTHHNMLWTAEQSGVVLQSMLKKEDSTLLFLPLAHVFARLVQYLFLQANVPMGYARSSDTLIEDLPSFRPTFLLAVPRVFEKVFNGAQRKATGVKRKIFDWAVQVAYKWSEAVDAGRSPGLLTSAQHGFADKLVYSKLRDAMGGQVNHCVSGGAPLAPHLAHFFNAAGITILEGYGLTETTAPATVNSPDQMRIGTVGVPLPGVEVSVADDGEVLIRGGNVFPGYFNNDEATRDVLDEDGWFHSGDLGELDEDGFLAITGRKKEIIVTAGGKNVAPAVLEERLKAHALVSQAMVVGDNRPFVAALVTLDAEELASFASERGLEGSTAELAGHEAVRAEIDKAVEHANAAVSKAETIRKTRILERDFTQENEELTPTLKLRRNNVVQHFADEIEGLYEQ